MKYLKLVPALLLLLLVYRSSAQMAVTNEAVWRDGVFTSRYVPGFTFMNDGRHYTRQSGNAIQQYDFTSGELVSTVFDGAGFSGTEGFPGNFSAYAFSDDESKIMLTTGFEPIYRRSSKAFFWIYDRAEKSLQPVFPQGKHSYASFNPQADKVAFVFENNLYFKDLKSGSVHQVTEDGAANAIINGATDWVYEEEFGFAVGFAWSPNGSQLAYYRFDERHVKEFTMTNYKGGLYPEYETFKYPKVGEANAFVVIFVFDVETKTKVQVDLGAEKDQYVPRIKWAQGAAGLCVYRLNRHQNHLELLLADSQNGTTRLLLEEKETEYVAEMLFDNLTFLKDGKHFIWSSERDDWHHLYLFDMQGQLVRPLTSGNWEVTNFYGVDEARGLVYYQAAKVSPMQREIYSVKTDGSDTRLVTGKPGWNNAQFSSTFDYYVLNHATINSPATYTVFDRSGKELRVIEDNAALRQKMGDYGFVPAEFFSFTTSENVSLNGYMLKPANMEEGKAYPVFMFLYGGPGSQQVTDNWGGDRFAWFQMLTQQGFIVACVDNRGTGARGEAFKKMTYLQMGKYETMDQIEAAKYLGGLPYADAARIGIFGWSYGGYMSSLCLLKGNDVFNAAIAVAPVTSWRWYDSIYTERFMRTEKENPEGYAQNSPVYFADQLKGNYLLVHGNSDDNVHFQHTAEMANALIKANKQFDTYFYPNRNHGIYGDNARLHLYTKMTNFLQQHLKSASSHISAKP